MPNSSEDNKNMSIGKESDVSRLRTLQVREVILQEKLDTAQKQLSERQTKIDRLQDQLNKTYKAAEADESLIQELEKSRLDNRALTKETELRTDRIIDLEGSLEVLGRELDRSKLALNNMERAYVQEQEVKSQLETDLNRMNQKTQASFEMADISHYLTGVINEFNEAVNTGDTSVNYIIKGLDVEMKAHIAKTEDKRMLMTAPSLSANSDDSLSMIKFSIAAVPKDETSHE